MKNILEKYKIILLVLLSLCHLDFTLRLTFSSIKKKLTIDKSNSIQIQTELIKINQIFTVLEPNSNSYYVFY